MSKKLFGLVLALVMALALALPASALSEGEQKAMDRWNGNGVLAGIETSDPSKSVTRGETAIAFANLLKLEQSASLAGFADIPAGASYADAMAKCVAAGIFKGNGDGTMTPDEALSREMFFVVFGRALGFAEQQAAAGSFSDADQISSWAKGMLNALIAKGYVKGVPGNILNPKGSMTTANLASLLDQTIDVYANANGEYTANGNGVALVVAKDVTVKGKTQDLVAVGGAEGGALKLDGLTVTGEAIINADTAVTTNNTKIASLSFKTAAKLNGQAVAAGYESKDSSVAPTPSTTTATHNQRDVGEVYVSESELPGKEANPGAIANTIENTAKNVEEETGISASVGNTTRETITDENGNEKTVTRTSVDLKQSDDADAEPVTLNNAVNSVSSQIMSNIGSQGIAKIGNTLIPPNADIEDIKSLVAQDVRNNLIKDGKELPTSGLGSMTVEQLADIAKEINVNIYDEAGNELIYNINISDFATPEPNTPETK